MRMRNRNVSIINIRLKNFFVKLTRPDEVGILGHARSQQISEHVFQNLTITTNNPRRKIDPVRRAKYGYLL